VVGAGKTAILGQKVVQVSRAASPDAENEQGRINRRVFDPSAIHPVFPPTERSVWDAGQGDCCRTAPIRQIDGELILVEDLEPEAQRDARKGPSAKTPQDHFTP